MNTKIAAQPKPIGKQRPDWRSTLTPDDLATVTEAQRYAERWAGAQNNSPLILIDKLAKLLDGDNGPK